MIVIKLSEMSADHVFDTLAVAGEEIEKILKDESLMKKLSTLNIKDENESVSDFGFRKIKDMMFLVVSFSKTHRMGIYKIVAQFKELSIEEVGKLPLKDIWAQISESFNDELFLSFFPKLRSLVQKKSSNISSKQPPAKHKE